MEKAACRLRFSVPSSKRRRAVTKNDVIIPICFIVVSGCSIFDRSEMTTETPMVSGPVAESEAPQAAPEVTLATSNEATIVPSRSISIDDIRRLQMRLRELGFYPGTADGVAGAKTKTAFNRLETGCAKLEPLSENLPVDVVHGFSGAATAAKVPTSADTAILQSQLRSAGFDPGPVDGILGAKTKSLIAILHSSCLMAKEFQGTLDQRTRAANLETRIAPPAETSKPLTASVSARNETTKLTSAPPPRSQDEIRILQLRLRDLGFDPGPFDGVMGAKTKSALAQYEASQRNRKIKTGLTTTNISGQY
jgi:peptidoglycan hydrolase-like protein with peptidoglycan-binding domain